MTHEVTIYQQFTDPLAAIKTLGTAITKSQIFGCQNEAQGEILALECVSKGLSPFALAENYDIIQGKLSMKADAMLARFEEAGGKYKPVEYSPEVCEIEFARNESTLKIRITWEDAKQESWPYKGDGTTLKHNWASPIARQDMLWARVVSRGVRRLAPGVVCGRYTPEEINDFSPEPAAATPTANTATTPAAVTSSKAEVVDAEYEVVSESVSSGSGTTMALADPVLESTVDSIKAAIAQAAQLGTPTIAGDVKKKLVDCGLERLSDLTQQEAETLLGAIEKKALGAWLVDESLRGHQQGNETSGQR